MRVWSSYLGVGLLLGLVYLVLPFSAQVVLELALGSASVAAQVVGIRLHRPTRPAPWWLLAGGTAAFVVGDAVYGSYDLRGLSVPFPSPADGVYVLGYPLLLAGLGICVRRSGPRDNAAWLDAGIWTGGAFVAAWLPLISPYAASPSIGSVQRWLALAFPVVDLVLLLLLVHLMNRQQEAGRAHRLLAYGLLLLFLADVGYGMGSLTGTYRSGGFVDVGWLASYAFFGAAALHPNMHTLSEPRVRSEHPSPWRLLALILPGLTAPALLAVLLWQQRLIGDVRSGTVVVTATTMLFLLSALRGRGLITDLRNREAGLELALRDRERLTEELRSRATCCPLTGLVNRTGFMELLTEALRGDQPLAVGLLDLDDFKGVNDTLGHEAGDTLLVEVASRLLAAVGPRDVVGRLGGDEFAVLLRGDVRQSASRLVQVLNAPLVVEGQELRVEASLGVVERGDHSSLGDLMRRADVAMYAAKAAGGNRWLGYRAEMSASLLRRLDLRTQLVLALERREIAPWFQPIVDLQSGDLIGFEALARWSRPGHEVEAPGDWIGLAEQTGLVVPIDFAVLEGALRQLATWRSRTPEAQRLHLAVNASGRTLQEPGTAARVLALLARTGVPADSLVLEVTEGVLLEDEAVGRRLQHLRAEGVRIALDDFGTGWSSLSYLARFPVDVLKLDRSFTATLHRGRGGEAVPAAVVQLARALDLEVVAEGIETEEQAVLLRRLGAQSGQGYLFGRPAPAEASLARVVAAGVERVRVG